MIETTESGRVVVTVDLRPAQFLRLQETARQQGISFAEALRRVLDAYFALRP